MAADEKWYFTKDQLSQTPSLRCGYDADRELLSRQQAAHLIQDMGQRLQVSQLCINTAMVYMHRFYVFHSFSQFHLDAMAAAALFLAAKVEEQPRKLEHVIRVKQICQQPRDHQPQPALDNKSEQYLEQAQDLVFNENVLLQTLGFDVAIDHPHTHVVRCCHLVRASKDLAQTSYFMASNSLHLTTMCLQYKPTVVACFCIHLACKWSNWEIPQSNEGKYWFYYVDKTVTQDLLEQLTDEFLVIFEKCPSRLKKKIKANQTPATYQFDKMSQSHRDNLHEGVSFQSHHRPLDPNRPSTSHVPQSSSQRAESREYQEKRERDRQMASQTSHSQHRDGHHRGHHMANLHPSSSTAQAKPHANLPQHNKIPHPGQHRSSSLSHHPRPDHHSRPDHSQRPEHQSRSDHQQRQDYQQRQDRERQPRPEHGSRPEHHPRGDHPLRPDQGRPDQSRPDQSRLEQGRPDQSRLEQGRPEQGRPEQGRPDHHQVRMDHQQRGEHASRPDHHRSDHLNRPDQGRPEHQGLQSRPDHPGSQGRSDPQRLDPSARVDQANRQEHPLRPEYPSGLERHDRLDAHADQRHGGVTAARDQLRRDAAMQREAVRREALHTSSLLNHSPAQRTASADSAISSNSSTSLTPSSQDWSGFGVTSAASGGPSPLPPKHPDPGHRHSSGYEKPKSSNSAVDSYGRHRGSLPGTDRRPSNAAISMDRKMMQEISERRQLESFFGKTEAQERMNEKHQVKHLSTASHKDIKKEPENIQLQPQPAPLQHIKREKVSPSLQPLVAAPTARNDMDLPALPSAMHQNNYKPSTSEYPTSKNIKVERDAETISDSRNGTTAPALITPKLEKIEPEGYLMSNRLPPVKSSIFSPEKTLPKERESPVPQQAIKTNCPPSPGIAFGSPPITPGKSQGSISRSDHKSILYPPAASNTSLVQGRSGACVPEVQSTASPQLPVQDGRSIVPMKNTDVRTAMPLVPIQGDLGAVAFPASEAKDLVPALPSEEGDHHHHKSKKKKEKKEKHKHKDKEKHREEKKHKSKHKEKDKERRKSEAVSEGLQPSLAGKPELLKIKIPKANITPPPAPAVAAPSSGGGLKLKISLSSLSSTPSGTSSSKESRKRERDRSSPGVEPSHSKAPKLSNAVETPKRSGNPEIANHGVPSKSNYARQNGLEPRGGNQHHMRHPQHYSGSKMVMDDGSTPEISKNHSSTS